MPRLLTPVKLIAILGLLMLLGLLRAEQGVSGLQGRVGEPSRLLYITNDRHGVWAFSVLGFHYNVNTAVVLVKRDQPLLAIPVKWQWPEVEWRRLGRRAVDWIQTCFNDGCLPLRELERQPDEIPNGRPV